MGKTLIKQITCIKRCISKIPLHIILNQPAFKIMIVLHFAIIIFTFAQVNVLLVRR